MPQYCVNKQAQNNGDHEVHKEGCLWYPLAYNRINLGYFHSCHGAVVEARKYYIQVNGCAHCSPVCHTT